MVKNTIRKSLLAQGQLLSESFILKSSKKIQKCAIEIIAMNPIRNILLYFPYRSEISLNTIMLEIKKYPIDIYVPKIISDKEMKFNQLEDNSFFEKNKFGINEVVSNKFLEPSSFDIMIIPFVGVDKNGARLGYGGGFFDRALKTFINKNVRTTIIGLGYNYQILDKIFGEVHDIKYDIVITESQIIRFSSRII